MGLTGRSSKRRRRYFNQSMNAFNKINKEYGLGMEPKSYEYIAWAIADAKVEARKGSFGGFNILGGIFTVVGSIFTGGVLGMIGGAVGMIGNKVVTNNAIKLGDLSLKVDEAYKKGAWLKSLNNTRDEGRNSLLTSDKTYSIYADGAIFSQNAPGSQSYSPTIAYDTSKGLRNDLKENKVDEMIMTRAHYTSGGNEGFITELSEGYIEKGEGGISVRETQDSLMIKARVNNERILKGFTELVGVGFDFKGTANKHYEEVVSKQVHPFFRTICSEDFIDKNKNYNRALRLELPLHFEDLAKTREMSEKEKKEAFMKQERFIRVVEEDYEAWLETSEDIKQIEKTIKSYERTIEDFLEKGNTYYAHIYTQKKEELEEKLEKIKADKKEALKNALYESETALMADDFYIQKSRLYTSEEKKENYVDMIEAKIDLFLSRANVLYFHISDKALNNAYFLEQEIYYNTDLKWLENNKIDLDTAFNTLYTDESGDNLISFYENVLSVNFANLRLFGGEESGAFYVLINNKVYFKVLESEVEAQLKEKIYKGF